MKRIVAIAVVLLLVGAVGWRVYRKASAAQNRSQRRRPAVGVAVEVTPVRRGTIRDVGRFSGTLRPRDRFVAAPKVGGRVKKILVDIGDLVQRGQLLALLDDDEFVQQVEQADAELNVAKARLLERRTALAAAQREHERVRVLRNKAIASESELDEAKVQYEAREAQLKVAQAQVAQREAALNAARIRLGYTKIKATWTTGDGARVVGERYVDEGAMLPPNGAIVSVVAIQSLIGVIHVIERDYARIAPRQRVALATDAFPGRTFTGTVVRIAPVLKEESRQARVEIEIPNPDRLLKPGMFVRAEIEFARHGNAQIVPLDAVVRRNERRGVFLADLKENKARFVPVKLGIIAGNQAEVVEPVLSGYVVTLGQHLLSDGSAISSSDQPPAGKSAQDAAGDLDAQPTGAKAGR